MTWQYDAGRAGMRLIRDWHPDVIWSTYPIATAHLIGETLHRRSGLPWIADFRQHGVQVGEAVVSPGLHSQRETGCRPVMNRARQVHRCRRFRRPRRGTG